MSWFEDMFGYVFDASPIYNFVFGIVLLFAGIIGFKYLPGLIGKLISFGMLLAGIVIATGYWVVIQ